MSIENILLELRKVTGSFVIKVEFSGGGDEGSVQSVEVVGLLDEAKLKELPVPAALAASYSAFEPTYKVWDHGKSTDRASTVHDFIEQWAYTLIEASVDFDWINNEGGGGTITIEPFTGVVRVDAYANITTTEDHIYDLSVEGDEFTSEVTAEDRASFEGA